jgi:hypothetical protein
MAGGDQKARSRGQLKVPFGTHRFGLIAPFRPYPDSSSERRITTRHGRCVVICPSGRNEFDRGPSRDFQHRFRRKTTCTKNRISSAQSSRFRLSRCDAKNIPLGVHPKSAASSSHPASCRGTYRDRHGTWRRGAVACEGSQHSFWMRTNVHLADGQAVWSWRSEAGAKSATMLTRLAGDGGNQAMVTEESAEQP